MKRVMCASALALFIAGGSNLTMHGQGGANPFIGHSDRGEIIHILPPPAAIREAHDPDPIFAPPSNQTAVYRASYGTRKLVDHGGLQIPNAGFYAIYWNSAVAGSTATSHSTTIQAEIDAFITNFPDNANYDGSTTDDYSIIQQYGSRPATPIANTLTKYGVLVDTSHDGLTQTTISDSQIRNYLASLFNSGVPVSSSVIYGVYFPSGMSVTSGTSASCSNFCGYHSVFAYGGKQIKYAAFPYLNCSGCSLSGLTVGDMLTIVTSHEIREAVTDPGDNGQNAWYDNAGYEADDKCAWHNLYKTTRGGFWVQPEFSNGGTVTASGFTATYPGTGCVVPNR
jgi:hypothetical protein